MRFVIHTFMWEYYSFITENPVDIYSYDYYIQYFYDKQNFDESYVINHGLNFLNYYHNHNISISDVRFPINYNHPYQQISVIEKETFENSRYVPSYKYKKEFHFSKNTTRDNVVNLFPVEVIVYPNPSNDFIITKIPGYDNKFHVSIYSLLGEKAMSGLIYSGDKIYLSKLQNGVYIYEVTS